MKEDVKLELSCASVVGSWLVSESDAKRTGTNG